MCNQNNIILPSFCTIWYPLTLLPYCQKSHFISAVAQWYPSYTITSMVPLTSSNLVYTIIPFYQYQVAVLDCHHTNRITIMIPSLCFNYMNDILYQANEAMVYHVIPYSESITYVYCIHSLMYNSFGWMKWLNSAEIPTVKVWYWY